MLSAFKAKDGREAPEAFSSSSIGPSMYSMTAFSDLIFPVLEFAQAKQVVEIGADTGGMSLMLAEYCLNHGGQLTSIDPAPTPAFRSWAALTSQVRHVDLPSLEAFPKLSNIDAWVIDGDHNWYTVYNEIIEAEKICRRENKPLLAFFHDVCWPCARRDMYYAPNAFQPNTGIHFQERTALHLEIQGCFGNEDFGAVIISLGQRMKGARATAC